MKLYKFILISALLFVFGCEDVLDKEPSNAPSSATVFVNADEIQLGLNSAYNHLDYKYVWFGSFEYSTALVLDAFSDIGWNRSDGGIQKIGEGEMNPDISILNTMWTNYYVGIAKANNILDNLDRAIGNIDPTELDGFQGEAMFIRAYLYYYLTALFGDVVLHTSVPEAGISDFPLTSQADVLAQVRSDIDDAIALLPEAESSKNRANKYTALALKARVALYMEDFSAAAEAAREVINSGNYALYGNFREMFTHAGENNEEVILSSGALRGFNDFAAVYLYGPRNTGGDGWSVVIPLRELVDSYETINGLPVDEDPSFDPTQPYENRDPRLKATVFTNGDTDPYYDPDFVFFTDPSKNTPDVTNAAATYSGFVYKKYVDEVGAVDGSNVGVDVILMRLAEMYLILAEANIEGGLDINEAISALNEVRARAYGVNVNETSAYPAVSATDLNELRRILRRERKVELAGEGFRLIDIRRWRIAEKVMPGKLYGRALTPEAWSKTFQIPQIDDETGKVRYADESPFEKALGAGTRRFDPSVDYFWMIPQSEVDANEALE